ncbi:uncharacterized protein LOC124293645 [Neodiprion lecontei]|uniref:Uncharacterized protein LOC124293645 n=1 Tax=Neodiprion lecontei TaxID=441921 RepID=A0ABM3FTA3_NEOLC|nr:uncharacterized protein LOC124293645 [Neodiprion lecontei]
MRTPTVICVSSVLLVTISTVIGGDYEIHNKGPDSKTTATSVEYSGQSQNAKLLSIKSNDPGNTSGVIIESRRKRKFAVNWDLQGTKSRPEVDQRKRKKKRERDGGWKRAGKDGERKRGRKREPLRRLQARKPQRGIGRRPAKGHPRQRDHHERRNLEKEYLVRNRTLELLDMEAAAPIGDRSSFAYPVNNVRGVLFGRRVTPDKIGEILGEVRETPITRLRIADIMIPKREVKPGEPEEPRCNCSGKVATVAREPPLFLGKLKSVATNVSRIKDTILRPKSENNSTVRTESGVNSYHLYDYENVFEDPSVSPWVNPAPAASKESTGVENSRDEDSLDRTTVISSVYMPIDDRFTLHQGVAALLARLFQTLRNGTGDDDDQELLQDLDFDNSVQGDLCQKWLDSKDTLEEAFLGPLVLPACPCHYPSSIFYDDKIWDQGQERYFRWRDVSGEAERLDVYKPGATYCIRSLLVQGGGSAAAQHCCYDGKRRLLTRGSGAGTPNLVSPEVSGVLHERIDILPWRLCKGDFSRFNKVRPPNNDNQCKGNPDEEEYQRQINETKHY